jgi:hypothetical protein
MLIIIITIIAAMKGTNTPTVIRTTLLEELDGAVVTSAA